ncbi:hypothetical protein [Acholeplasma hippikon]|uniref:Predicted NADH:ubiquinone oxidoreductase, subunit RnfA n=1 Tax=Acholeplasma hippikon TaxID=264636 RepID=A0A449BKK4_9MOLU|nr:hypothetical protein [Acholeplasma hippikon]VEU82996.1 Predicted NADH:ubiquinone oxidoreductase, subunit RnfA [Acholeplasma hippikon]
MTFYSILASLLTAAILSNVVLQGLGLEVLSQKELRVKNVFIRACIIAVLAFVAYLIDFVLYTFILVPLDATFLNLVVVALLAIGLNEIYQLLVAKVKLSLPQDEKIGLQSVLLLVAFMGIATMTFGNGIVIVLGSLVGYILFASLITIIQTRIRINPVLKGFKGLPILLIIIGLIAMVLTGLGGIF